MDIKAEVYMAPFCVLSQISSQFSTAINYGRKLSISLAIECFNKKNLVEYFFLDKFINSVVFFKSDHREHRILIHRESLV
jgi:hypothetical protein